MFTMQERYAVPILLDEVDFPEYNNPNESVEQHYERRNIADTISLKCFETLPSSTHEVVENQQTNDDVEKSLKKELDWENEANPMETQMDRTEMDPLDDNPRSQILCRVCANDCVRFYPINSNICNFSTTIKDMVILLVPQMANVLEEYDVVCNKCRQTLISCVRFIDKCLRVEADRKDKLLSHEAPVNDWEDDNEGDTADDESAYKQSPSYSNTDNLNDNDKQDVNISELGEDFENKADSKEAIDEIIDITKSEHDYFLKEEDTKINLEPLPNIILEHNRIITTTQPSSDAELNKFIHILASSNVKTFQYSLDSGQNNKRKRVLLIGATFKCNECNKFFNKQKTYDTHLRMHQRVKDKRSEREKMRKLKSQKLEEKKHRKLDAQLNPPERKPKSKSKIDLQCKTCFKECDSKEDLDMHLQIHPPFVCEQCGKGFPSKQKLNVHGWVHNDPNSFICEICGKSAKTRCQLRVHIEQHQNNAVLCNKCPKVFNNNRRLKIHLKFTHGEGLTELWSCKECGKIFKRLSALKNHYGQVHRRDGGHLKCDVCGQGFYRRDYLKRHKRRHVIYGEEGTSNSTGVRRYRELSGPYECKICNKIFQKLPNLKLHIRSHGTLQRYNCKYCSRTFKIKYQRNRHEKFHEDSTLKFKCGICWKQLDTQEELDEHTLTHNNLKYKCDICDESFARKHLLTDHIVYNHAQNGDAENEIKTLMSMGLGDLYRK